MACFRHLWPNTKRWFAVEKVEWHSQLQGTIIEICFSQNKSNNTKNDNNSHSWAKFLELRHRPLGGAATMQMQIDKVCHKVDYGLCTTPFPAVVPSARGNAVLRL